MSSQQIPGYKRHSLDEFTPEIKRQRTNQKLPNGDVKKTRGRVKINIEINRKDVRHSRSERLD